MYKIFSVTLLLLLSNACSNYNSQQDIEFKAKAERFFRGVYGGDPTVVDDLAGNDIIVSYPVFERLFNTQVIHGQEAVKDFATGFGKRWVDVKIIIHETVAEDSRVILIWSFEGRNVGSAEEDKPPTNQKHSWGGITFYRFNGSGKIVAEIGEESVPGPIERSTVISDSI
jgi:hypothetical protein